MRQVRVFVVFFMVLSIVIHRDVQAMWINNNGEYVKQAIIVDKKIKEEDRYLIIDVEVPQINGIINENAEKVINSKIMDYTYMWINEVKEISKEYFGPPLNEVPTFPYKLVSRYEVKRNNDILSMYIDYYEYAGGAHGITNRVTYNIDVNTGKELYLKDLFKSKYDYTSIINDEINKQIAKTPEAYFKGTNGFNGIKDNQQYFLEDGYLIVQFQYYDIAPYASGMPQFRIPLESFKDNFLYGKI